MNDATDILREELRALSRNPDGSPVSRANFFVQASARLDRKNQELRERVARLETVFGQEEWFRREARVEELELELRDVKKCARTDTDSLLARVAELESRGVEIRGLPSGTLLGPALVGSSLVFQFCPDGDNEHTPSTPEGDNGEDECAT